MPEKDKKVGFEANLRVEVSRVGESDYYVSRIDALDEDTFYMPLPYSKLHPLVLYKGDDVTIKFAGEQESFMFHTTVLDVQRDKVPMYRLRSPTEIIRVQQRHFVRLPVLLEAYCAWLPEGKELPKYNSVRVLDISGGGLKIATDVSLKVGEVLLIKLDLPPVIGWTVERFNFTLKAEVVRIKTVKVDDEVIYHLGLKFLNITQKQQDKIVCFVFQKMTDVNRYS